MAESLLLAFDRARSFVAESGSRFDRLFLETVLGDRDVGALAAEIERVIGMFRNGGLLYCTSHFVQDHCTMDELRFAFDTVRRISLQYAG